MATLDPWLLRADELGIRLELSGGLPKWEPHPVLKHQRAVDRIRATIGRAGAADRGDDCAGMHVSDVYVRFPDGSLLRPDIAIFCREPDEEEEGITLVPAAVIEIVSRGYERKDLEINPPVYLANGVGDVVVFNPYTSRALHLRPRGSIWLETPAMIELACGCRCVVS